MSNFFNRGDELERELRRNRPEPRPEFVASLAARVKERPARVPRYRLAFAGVLTAAILTSLAAFGGLSYAASAVQSVAHVATRVVAPTNKPTVVKKTSAAAAYGKTTICHFDGQGRGHTITVSDNAVANHLGHGDHRGACKSGEFKPGSLAAKLAAKKKAANAKKGGTLGTTRSGKNPSSTG